MVTMARRNIVVSFYFRFSLLDIKSKEHKAVENRTIKDKEINSVYTLERTKDKTCLACLFKPKLILH